MNKEIEILKNFYCLEGANGAGKTTIINKMKEICEVEYPEYEFIFTKEPSTGDIGRFIRHVISPKCKDFDKLVLEYLFTADRLHHLYDAKNGIVEKAKNPNTRIISDRYLFSSMVYNPENYVKILNKNFPLPEIVFYIKLYNIDSLENRPPQPSDGLGRLTSQEDIRADYINLMRHLEEETTVIELTNISEADVERNARIILNRIFNKERK